MIPNLAAFEILIKSRTGLHFDNSMQALLQSALTQRMSKRGISSSARYFDELSASESEFDCLLSLLTINETYFFREVNVLDYIAEKLVPRLRQQRSGPVRILSAGCSSGEEAYSLAIKLHQKYHEGMRDVVELHGCDIDPQVLEKARNATYSSYSFRGVDPVVQSSYFTRSGSQFRLHDNIRQRVSFHRLNLIKEQLQPAYDIILLRNVSIYFDTETRRELHHNLLQMLQPEGVVFFGNAETMANNFGILKLALEEGLFYFVNTRVAEESAIAPRVEKCAPRSVPASVEPETSQADKLQQWLQKAEFFMADKLFDQAAEYVARVLAAEPGNKAALLIQGVISLEQCEFDYTARQAQKVLDQDEWSAEAKMLLGLASMWQQHTQQAIGWFKQVVYQHPGYWPAHYYLAEMYRQSDLEQPAQRTYRIVLQLLNAEMHQQTATGLLHLPMTFSNSAFRFLCEHQLAKFAHQGG